MPDLPNPKLEVPPAGVATASGGAMPSGGSPTSAGHPVRAALFLSVAVVVCVLGYLAHAIPASWLPSATPKAWGARDLSITRGEGSVNGKDVVVTSVDPSGYAIVSVNTGFSAADYPVVAWDATGLSDAAEVRLFWRTDLAPSRLNSLPLNVVAGRLRPAAVNADPAWVGRIGGIALLIRGPLAQPVRVHGVTVKPMGLWEVLHDLVREWVAFEGWSGASINTVVGGAELQQLPVTPLLAVAIALASAAWYGLARRRGWLIEFPTVIAVMLVSAWCVLDARWMLELGRQVVMTAAQFQGKDSRERSLAAEDGPLYAFIERARERMPATPARVFIVADAAYFRGRGAYHLYPHNVYFDPSQNVMPPSSQLRPGDYLIVYYRRGVQFDPARQLLRWEGQEPIAAEALLVEPYAVLFRIR